MHIYVQTNFIYVSVSVKSPIFSQVGEIEVHTLTLHSSETKLIRVQL